MDISALLEMHASPGIEEIEDVNFTLSYFLYLRNDRLYNRKEDKLL